MDALASLAGELYVREAVCVITSDGKEFSVQPHMDTNGAERYKAWFGGLFEFERKHGIRAAFISAREVYFTFPIDIGAIPGTRRLTPYMVGEQQEKGWIEYTQDVVTAPPEALVYAARKVLKCSDHVVIPIPCHASPKFHGNDDSWMYKGLKCHWKVPDLTLAYCGYVDMPCICDTSNVIVHGGVTYSEHQGHGVMRYGFDTSHIWIDWVPAAGTGGGTYKTMQWVKEETERFADQLLLNKF